MNHTEMTELKKTMPRIKLSFAVFFFLMGFGGLWLLNDLMTGMHITVKQTGIDVGTTTGFQNFTYVQTFHAGLWTISISLFMLLLFVIWSTKHDTKNN